MPLLSTRPRRDSNSWPPGPLGFIMQKRMVNASSRLRHRAFVFLRIFLMMLLLSRNACKAEFYVVIQPSGNEQCFMIEQPQGTPVTVDYDLPAYATQSLNLVISLVSGPGGKGGGGKMVQQVQMNEEKGQFKFATVKDGFHSLCIVPHTVTKPTKVGLEVTYGKSDAYYADLAKEAHIDLLEASIMHLNAQMGQILNEADYMKDKEVLFHQQCERTNSAARWWPILQVGILLVTGVLQVNNLKQFFKARRLV